MSFAFLWLCRLTTAFALAWLWRRPRRRRLRPAPLPPQAVLWDLGGGWRVEGYLEVSACGCLAWRHALVSPNRRENRTFTARRFPPAFSPE